MTEISSVLASDYAMTRSSARPSRKLSPSPWCPCCLARRRARDLIDSSRFDAAVELLEAEVKGAGVDVNGNLRRDSSEGAEGSATCEACAAIVPTTNLAEKWSLLSMARLERSVVGENDLFRAWEEVPKRHKKKFSTFVELFKSLKKIPADLKAFHVSFSSYERGIKGAVEAAEKALRLESTFFEAHFHMARAIYKLENLSATEEKKTISAAQHIAKYLRLQFGDESAPPGFNPKGDAEKNNTNSDDDEEEEEDESEEDEDPLNSGDDMSDDFEELFRSDNLVLCKSVEVIRGRGGGCWRIRVKDGIANLDGQDVIFKEANSDAISF